MTRFLLGAALGALVALYAARPRRSVRALARHLDLFTEPRR